MIAGVAAKRMNREQFFRAASGLDEDRLRKALWNLYWPPMKFWYRDS